MLAGVMLEVRISSLLPSLPQRILTAVHCHISGMLSITANCIEQPISVSLTTLFNQQNLFSKSWLVDSVFLVFSFSHDQKGG
jgi:hypothetical protein